MSKYKFIIISLISIALYAFVWMGMDNSGEIRVDVKVIHPKSREWATPNGGITTQFNPPTLLWPLSKEGNYSIRLSQRADFSGELIQKDDLSQGMFNPHQKLADGTWFWQYKSAKNPWSKVANFHIGEQSQEFVTPEAATLLSMIPEGHPRVFAWKSELDDLRQRAKTYKEAKEIISAADDLIHLPIIDESMALPKFEGSNKRENRKIAIDASRKICDRVQDVVSTLSQAYILTEKEQYAVAAKRWIMAIADWDPEGATRVTDFGDSGIMHAMAIGFDTFYGQLTEDQREKLLKSIAARGAHFYDEWLNFMEGKLLSNHVWQHILERFFQTALAVKGDLPIADEWLSYIYDLWLARSPILGHKDGSWSNGISYFRMNTLTMLSITSTLKEITGVDFFKDEWYYNNTEWMIYAYPPHGSADGFGNDAYKLGNPLHPRESKDAIYSSYAELNGRLTGNANAIWYVDKRLEGTGQTPTSDLSLKWYFIQRGLQLKRPDPPKQFELSQARVFPEVGLVYMNTHLEDTPNNFQLAMKSSPYGSYSHTHAEQNGFNMFYGGQPLFSNTGYRPAMGDPHYLADFKNTRGHNSILINDMGQPFSSEAYGWVPRFLHGKAITYAVGDATNAYSSTDANEQEAKRNSYQNNANAGLKRFRRHALMLPPNMVVIYDELETEQPVNFTFLLQNRDSLAMDNQHRVTASNGAATAQVTLFGSESMDHELTDQFAHPPENWRRKTNPDGSPLEYKNHWHYQATNTEKSKNMRFLAVIQIQGNGLFYHNIEKSGNNILIGEWKILAELEADQPAFVEVKKNDGSAAFRSSGVLEFSGKQYKGTMRESAKLLEIVDGKPKLQETVDVLPESIANVLALDLE